MCSPKRTMLDVFPIEKNSNLYIYIIYHIATKHQGQLKPPGQTTRACYPCSCSFSSGPWCPCYRTDAVLSLRPSWSRRRRRRYHKSTNHEPKHTETMLEIVFDYVWLMFEVGSSFEGTSKNVEISLLIVKSKTWDRAVARTNAMRNMMSNVKICKKTVKMYPHHSPNHLGCKGSICSFAVRIPLGFPSHWFHSQFWLHQ